MTKQAEPFLFKIAAVRPDAAGKSQAKEIWPRVRDFCSPCTNLFYAFRFQMNGLRRLIHSSPED